jgi:hypothetical protein
MVREAGERRKTRLKMSQTNLMEFEKEDFMEIPMPERRCKRHHWKDGWICEKCGINRADYEFIRTQDRAKYWIVNYGENETRKFGHLHQARAFGFHYWHEGHKNFRAYNIVRVSNINRRVVYQQAGDILK